MRICDRLPARIVLIAKPRQAKLGGGQVCWALHGLTASSKRQLTMRVQATRTTRTSTVANTAVMTGVNIRRTTATARVRVAGKRPPSGSVIG